MNTRKPFQRIDVTLQRKDFISNKRLPVAITKEPIPEENLKPIYKNKLHSAVVNKLAPTLIYIRNLPQQKQRLVYATCSVMLITSILITSLWPNGKAEAQVLSQGPRSATASSDCVNDAGTGTVAWTNPGNAFASDDTNKATASVDGTTTNYIKCTNFGFSVPTNAEIVGIVVGVERMSSSTGNGGSNDAAMRIVKGGTIGTTDKSTTTTWGTSDSYENHGSSGDLWGDTWTATNINASNFGAAISATKAASAGAAHTVSVDHMRITVYYAVSSQIDLNGYIWENDDGVDSGTAQAAGNTAITGVRKGERLSLRAQIKNTGNDTLNGNLGLFYDENDGNFVQVGGPRAKLTSGSGCAAAPWSCSSIDTGVANTGRGSSIAFSPDGIPYISYYFVGTGGTTDGVMVAQYVGTGGTGCDSSAWTCTIVESANVFGQTDTNIAFSPSGAPYVSYYTGSNGNDLRVAQYVGGTSGTGCTSNAWTCTVVDAANDEGLDSSIAFDQNGFPYVSYRDEFNTQLKVAQYLGGATTGTGCNVNTWTCTVVDTVTNAGYYTDIAFSPNGKPYISYYDVTNSSLMVAQYVGSGGTDCSSSAWTCTEVDLNDDVGHYTSIAFSPSGVPYVSYYDATGKNLRLAQYVGGGSGSGCASNNWTCTVVDSANDVGAFTSIAFSPRGTPYISYYDLTAGNLNLRVAQYVGGTSGTGCASSAWTCTDIETTNDVGGYSSIAFGSSGVPYVSYYDATNSGLRVAQLSRFGAITFAPSMNSGSTAESHADMTSTTDTSNRDDADCISGGTWQNGTIATAPEVRGLALSAGNCTEVVFTIDTSQATPGTTYRFIIASADALRADKGKWRGPNAVASGAYATLTISSETDSTIPRASKDVEPQGGSCTDSAWTCMTVDSQNVVGQHSSLAFSPAGVPYISYYDAGANNNLVVAQYVGSGGSCVSSSAWTCTTVASADNVGSNTSIAFSPSGVPYVSYYESTNFRLWVAHYVGGTSGTGCASSAWTCTILDASLGGQYTSIAFSPSGVPYISYYDGGTDNDLVVAQYVGSGGTGCASLAWTCTDVDTANSVGQYTSIAFSPSGVPYISYYDSTNFDLRIAQYVGSGGTGCASTAWTCTAVDTSNNVGQYTSLAFSPSGTPYVSYREAGSPCGTGGNCDLRVAQYVGGTSGSGCASSAWTCTAVDTTNDVGQHTSIAFSPSGVPYVSYYDLGNGNLRVAQYLNGATSGTGCAVNTWTCTAVDTASAGEFNSIAFSPNGTPYISYFESFSSNLRVAKLSTSSEKLINSTSYVNPGNRNGTWSEGRFHLADGRSARTQAFNPFGGCGGVSAFMGYCGLFNDDGNTDSITAQINERPVYNFTYKVKGNSEVPTLSWIGRSSLAPNTSGNTGDLKLQVYRFGPTNAWVDVATNSVSSNCSTENCKLIGSPGGTVSEFYEADGSDYRIHVRVWQYESGSQTIDFKTDLFQLQFLSGLMRHGTRFENNIKRPLSW